MKLSQLKIDPEFQSKIPPLQFEEEQQLEQNIIAEGRLLNPIITWNGYILDGHTRYRILKKHGFTSHAKHRWKIGTKVFHQMAKALLTDGLLSTFPAADACPADLCMVGKLLTAPTFCLPVSAEEVFSAPVQKQGVVVQNVLHRDAVKGGELVCKFGREAAVKCAAFQIPIEPFLHAHHGSNLFLQQVKTIAAPAQTVPWVRDVGVRVVHTVERLRLYGGAGACQTYL